jgi:exosome complex RNA-binding protein Csl4
MAVDQTPLVNGQAYAWVDIQVNIEGVPLSGITSVKYEEKAAIEDNYGAGRRPVSRGHGKIEATASISIDRAELNALISSAPNKNLFNIPEFDIVVAYLPDGSRPTVDTIKNCRFMNIQGGAAEGDSNVIAEIELKTSHILFDTLA